MAWVRGAGGVRRGAVLAVLLPLVLAGCGGKEAETAQVRPVRVAPVSFKDSHADRGFTGTIVPRTEVQAGFRVGGRIAARLVEVGDRVKPGQVLARLDPTDLALSLQAAEARLAQADAQSRQAAADLKRYTPLLASGTVSQAQFDRVKAAADAASAQRREAQSGLEIARNQRAYGSLTLDQGGVVTAVLADAGQMVGDGQTVLRMATDLGKEVAIDVAEADLARLSVGGAAHIALWADRDLTLAGTIREITPVADAASRTFRLRVTLPADAPEAVRLGMTANVRFPDAGAPSLALLPSSALFQQGDKPAVWVLAPSRDRVQLRPVEVASYRPDGVAVTGGVKEGELVVTAGAHRLDANLPVRVWDGGLP
ncbi:efflux RND transporter periplasmic adaptor subunit [Niveispirillum sp. KHB5.9]|uniref:efflux RND transporter periplasmic adaptor subunit n=1 Tax=Niveispirillum sp. KHB5.9 TaxID=3400269 RepID=UPI003A8C83E9